MIFQTRYLIHSFQPAPDEEVRLGRAARNMKEIPVIDS